MNRDLIKLYSDYLLSSFSKTTATGLSERLDNQYSHDRIARLLSGNRFSGTTLWRQVKPVVRKIEAPYISLNLLSLQAGKVILKSENEPFPASSKN